MPIADLGLIRSRQHNAVAARWDDETGVVEGQLYRFPLEGEPHWTWLKVGIAQSANAAQMTAINYLRGE
jgi:hypothetical protein